MSNVNSIIAAVAERLYQFARNRERAYFRPIEVDDRFVGGGYGVPTPASTEAQQLAARTEALFVDHTYTAKALAALIAYVRDGRIPSDATVLFWHTGGQVGLFA